MRALKSTMTLAVVASLAAGCGSCSRSDELCITEMSIEEPADGAVISWDQDENPNRTGLQITVEAAVSECMAESSPATLLVNGDTNRAREAFTHEGRVVFEQVTLVPRDAEGNVTLTASVRDGGSGQQAKHTIELLVADVPAVDCVFVAPVQSAVLGPDDDVQPERPGMQHDVIIACAEELDGTPANLTVDGVPVPSAIFADGVVTFSAVHLSEGVNVLRGQIATDSGTWVGEISVTVDTPDCEVRVRPSGAIVFNLDGDPPRVPFRDVIADADGDPTTGIMADILAVTPDCMGGRAFLIIDEDEVAAIDVEGEAVSFGSIGLPDGDDVRVHVEVRPVGDEGSRGRSVTQSYWVDSVRPAPRLMYPSPKEVLRGLPISGEGAEARQRLEISIEAPSLESFDDPSWPWRAALIEAHLVRTDVGGDGVAETVSCLVGIDGCEDPEGEDRYVLGFDLDLVADYEVEVVVTDPAGNVGVTEVVPFSVDARPVGVTIVSPEPDSVVNLEHPGVDGQTVPVVIQSEAPELAGAELRVWCSGAPAASGTIGQDLQAVVPVRFGDLPCGGRRTSCFARAVTSDGEHWAPAVPFHVDLVAPSLTIVSPSQGDVVFDTDVVVEVVTDCLEDEQSVRLFKESVLLATAPVSGGGVEMPVTLDSGLHSIWAAASDAAGNSGESGVVSFVVAADPPQVVFVDPVDGAELFGEPGDGESPWLLHDVKVSVANEPRGTPVSLQIGYRDGEDVVWRAPVATAVTSAEPESIADLDGVALPEGEFALRAVATGALGLRGEAVVWPRVETGATACNIVSPAGGSSIGPAQDESASEQAGVRHDVRVRTELEDGEQVALTLVDARGVEQVLHAAVADGIAVFEAVVFTTEQGELHGLNSLDAACGDYGRALPTEVRVDLEAPEALILEPRDGDVFNASSIDHSAKEGFQVRFRGAAASPTTGESVSEGAMATLTVVCDGDEPDTHNLNLARFGEDVEARARPTLADQSSCVLTFRVTDTAGNQSEPVSVTVVVDRVPPVLEIARPTDGRFFGSVDDRSPNPGFQQDVKVEYAGLEEGRPVRLFFQRFSEDGTSVESEVSPHLVSAATLDGFTFDRVTFTREPIDDVMVRVVATDLAGNEAVALASVRIDTVAPQVAITRPVSGGPCLNLLADHDPSTPGIQTRVDVATRGVAEGLPLAVCGTDRDDDGEACALPGYTVIGEATVAGDFATLQPVTLMDGEQLLIAEVEDLAGNYSRSEPVIVCADSIPPRVTSFVIPADLNGDGYLNAAELDAAGGSVCLDIGVEGAEGRTLTVRTNNPIPGTTLVSGIVEDGAVTICTAMPQGAHALEARVADVNGNPNIRSSNPVIENPEARLSLTIDTVAPSLTIVSPAHVVNASVAGAEGVDPTVTFQVSSNAEGRLVTFSVNGAEQGQAVVSGGTAKTDVMLPNEAVHTLSATVADAAGNVTQRTRDVLVDTTPPTVSIVGPSDGSTVSGNTFDVTVAVVGAAEGQPLRVHQVDGGTDLRRASVVVSSEQPQVVTVSLPEGARTIVARVSDEAGNVGQSDAVELNVEPVGCSIVWASPSSSPYRFRAQDGELGSEGGLVTTIRAEVGDGCHGRDVLLFENEDAVPVDQAVAAGSPAVAEFAVSFAQGEQGSFTARVEDSEGVVSQATFHYVVDVLPVLLVRAYPGSDRLAYVAPGNPTIGQTTGDGFLRLEDLTPADQSAASARFVFDVFNADGGSIEMLLDGATIHGPEAVLGETYTEVVEAVQIPHGTNGVLEVVVTDAGGEETRHELEVVVDVLPPAAPQVIASLDDQRAATVSLAWAPVGDDGESGEAASIEVRWSTAPFEESTYGTAHSSGLLPGAATSESLSPLPPLNTYTIAVRGRDAMDNLSPLIEGVNLIQVDNTWKRVEIAGRGGAFGTRMIPRGFDLNGNDHDDVVVSATQEVVGGEVRGAVYVYYGTDDPDGIEPQVIGGDYQQELFGDSLDAGFIADEDVPTLIVGAKGYQQFDGRAVLFFGRSDSLELDPADRVELRGSVGAGGQFGAVVRVLGDINDNGRSDLAIGAFAEDVWSGRVYVFFGRSKSEWKALADAEGYIGADEADLIIKGAPGDMLGGAVMGYADLGDFSGDGGDDFLVPAWAGKAYVFRSWDVMEQQALEGEVLASDAFQEIVGTQFMFPFDGFGFSADGWDRHVVLVDRASSPVVSLYGVSEDGVDDSPLVSLVRTNHDGVQPSDWGYSTTRGDLTGNGLPDIVVGTNGTATNRIDLYFNSGLAPYFDGSRPGAVLIGSNTMGVSVWMGDFTNDGSNEIVAAGSGEPGKLFMWLPKP